MLWLAGLPFDNQLQVVSVLLSGAHSSSFLILMFESLFLLIFLQNLFDDVHTLMSRRLDDVGLPLQRADLLFTLRDAPISLRLLHAFGLGVRFPGKQTESPSAST
jgi:hypothetical protein